MVQPRLMIKLDAIDPRSNGLTFDLHPKVTMLRRKGKRSMIDHMTMRVSNYDKSKAFYLAALAPLSYSLMVEMDQDGAKIAGFGWIRSDGGKKIDWWIVHTPAALDLAISGPTHLALLANDRAGVAAFYEAAIAAGGKDNGAPGLRPHYHADYYGAFVLDPDGNNIEAVCHVAQGASGHRPA
jgi:catechol 2,3-dioxygenase-like lactoylglutathione lyase family enzyme